LTDAKFVSLHKDGEKRWLITIVPNTGASEVSLILGTDKDRVEFPLTVAPAINIADGITEKNFRAELDKYLADQAAVCKLNKVPYRRYLLEFVFTANCLAGKRLLPPASP
jgi:hypothetical protein